MEVRNCRLCGKLFNYIGGIPVCPACKEELEKKYNQVKEYIRENQKATMAEISEDNDVSIQQINQWVREERLVFTDDSPIGIECENCGKSIKTGRYCEMCKNTMAKELGNAFAGKQSNENDAIKAARDRARMRYLDNH
jgi:flagellar operon protein (TIGR03826 family)